MTRLSVRFFECNTGKALYSNEITSGTEMHTLFFSDNEVRSAVFSSMANTRRCIVWVDHKGSECEIKVKDIFTGLTAVYGGANTTFTNTIFTGFIDGAKIYCMNGTTEVEGAVTKATGVATFVDVNLSAETEIYTYDVVSGTRVFLSKPLAGNKCHIQQVTGDREIKVQILNEEE